MAPLSEEDLEWFKSTFRPIPKPQLPEDCIEYFLYWITPKSETEPANESDLTRIALSEVQKAASGLVKSLLKDYIWQRESFKLELTKEDGKLTSLNGCACQQDPANRMDLQASTCFVAAPNMGIQLRTNG